MRNLLITIYPFSKINPYTLSRLMQICDRHGIGIIQNPYRRKLYPQELESLIKLYSPEIILAGTEEYCQELFGLKESEQLKMIARAGVGYDNVPLEVCKRYGITVSYTPEAPSDAVAEATVCQMLNMLRKIPDVEIGKNGCREWNRYIGRQLNNCIVGVIGCGRIGSRVIKILLSFGVKQLYINDVDMEKEKAFEQASPNKIIGASLDKLLPSCDIVTLHVPMTEETRGMIGRYELNMLKRHARIINFSRGGIIDENDLYYWLLDNPKGCAAVDTFEREPYNGKLINLKNAYLTAHIGACTVESRTAMEEGAIDSIEQYLEGRPIDNVLVGGE